MIDKLKNIIKEYDELMEQISSPDIMSDMKKYTLLARQEKNLSNFFTYVTIFLSNFFSNFKIELSINFFSMSIV